MKQSLKQIALTEQAAKIGRSRMKKLAGIINESAVVALQESASVPIGRFGGQLPAQGLMLYWSSDRDALLYVPNVTGMEQIDAAIDAALSEDEKQAQEDFDLYHEMHPISQEEFASFAQEAPNNEITVMEVPEVVQSVINFINQSMGGEDEDY
ncbi:hypothetical protein D3C75_570680 [compost metagenome]